MIIQKGWHHEFNQWKKGKKQISRAIFFLSIYNVCSIIACCNWLIEYKKAMPVDQIVYYNWKFSLKKSFTKILVWIFSLEMQLQFYLFFDSINSGKWKPSNFLTFFKYKISTKMAFTLWTKKTNYCLKKAQKACKKLSKFDLKNGLQVNLSTFLGSTNRSQSIPLVLIQPWFSWKNNYFSFCKF